MTRILVVRYLAGRTLACVVHSSGGSVTICLLACCFSSQQALPHAEATAGFSVTWSFEPHDCDTVLLRILI